ncbi:MAG: hypothetical protein ACP5I4_02605 [Oceanipulchritudo sp.]
MSTNKRKEAGIAEEATTPGLYLIVLAVSGWLILIANLFGVAGRSGWIFPPVEDLAGLAMSTLLLAILGMTPAALRHLFKGKDSAA